MRTTWLAVILFPIVAASAPNAQGPTGTAPEPIGFTVQSLQSLASGLTRELAVKLAESELWRRAFVRCSPSLDSHDSTAPVRLGEIKTESGTDPRDPYLKFTARFACGLSDAPDLHRRLGSAEQVILGRVVGVKPVPDQGPISSHRESWQIATLEVLEGLKGGASPHSKVDVRFQASEDIMWVGWPKLHVGQDGVFLLQRGKAGLSVESPLDVHPWAQYQDVWSVLHSP
jgi:hypothetical protein